uniref:Uncharacterized protein n=1 Tax=Oryza glumipatula TaxID=40148 RepID=A0A0E0APU0_9ORYZ
MAVMAPVGRYGGDEGLQIQRQRATERRNHRQLAELSLASADLEGGGHGSRALGRWPGSAEWGGIGESLLFGLGGGKGEGVALLEQNNIQIEIETDKKPGDLSASACLS